MATNTKANTPPITHTHSSNLADGGDMTMHTTSSQQRRGDPHLRMMVVGDAAPVDGQNPAAMLLARGDIGKRGALRWLETEINWVRVSALLQFRLPHICCHTGDAARVGKLAADLFFSTLWDPRSCTSYEYHRVVGQIFLLNLDCARHNYGECDELRHFTPHPAISRHIAVRPRFL